MAVIDVSSGRVSQPRAVNTSEQNLSPPPSLSADSTEVLQQDTQASARLQTPEECWWKGEFLTCRRSGTRVSCREAEPSTAAATLLLPAHASQPPQPRTREGTRAGEDLALQPCTHLSALHSQQDHKDPFILRYEICVVSCVFGFVFGFFYCTLMKPCLF